MRQPKLGKPTANGYRASKGFYRNGEKLAQKFFWLGHNALNAVGKMMALDRIAGATPPNPQGQLVWDDDGLKEVEAAFAAVEAGSQAQAEARPHFAPPPTRAPAYSVFPSQPLPPRPDLAQIKLHKALDQYATHVGTKNEIAAKTKMMTRSRIKSLKIHLPNLPLREIGFEQLQQFRSIITARPQVRRPRRKTQKADESRRISILTTRNWLATLGQVFDWFRKTNRWVRPSGVESEDVREVFSLNKVEQSRLCTGRSEREKLHKPKPCPTLEELSIYYRLAASGQRLYLLMGICLGWRQSQIAALRKVDLFRRGGEYFIKFERTKTNVTGELWVCPELAEMLVARISKTPDNPDNYALLTENDMPLVHPSVTGETTDSIGLVWNCLRGRAEKLGCQSYSFDSLRRFASQVVTNLGDPFLAQVFLAQVPASVLEQHYAGRGIGVGIGNTAFEKVQEVQRKVHAALTPMFDAAAKPTNELVEALKQRNATEAAATPQAA